MDFQRKNRISINTGKETIIVEVETILYCETWNGYVTLYRENMPHIVTPECLKSLETKLKEHSFVCINKGLLVNIQYITRFPYRSTNNKVFLSNGTTLDTSRRKKKNAYEQWKKYFDSIL
jgi:two-component system LytT family response regulator